MGSFRESVRSHSKFVMDALRSEPAIPLDCFVVAPSFQRNTGTGLHFRVVFPTFSHRTPKKHSPSRNGRKLKREKIRTKMVAESASHVGTFFPPPTFERPDFSRSFFWSL